MSSLSIGLSGLQVSQKLLDVTGQNIANANTPNYHREVANLGDRVAGNPLGLGVEIRSLTRVLSPLLEDAVMRNTSDSSHSSSLVDGLSQLQSYIDPGPGSLNDTLQNFFNQIETLSTQPDDLTQRSVVLSAAGALADQFNAADANLTTMRDGVARQITQMVGSVNALTTQIANLNRQIHGFLATGQSADGLLEQRDAAVAELSQYADLRVVPQDFGQINLYFGGTPIILNSAATQIGTSLDTQQQLHLVIANSQQTIDPTGGQLTGALNIHNSVLPSVRSQLNDLADAVVAEVNGVHATGVGMNGPMTNLGSLTPLTNTALPLASANLAPPPIAGDLYITVTNTATGARSLSRVVVDPTTQTLGDLATAISAVPHIQAVVDAQAGTIRIVAQPGYGFDFTGTLSTTPDVQAITGTTTATISGHYTGAGNDTLNFSVVGTGAIGVTPNLTLEARNGAGVLVSSLNIGLGYEAGTNLTSVLGVNVKLSPGTVNNGDTFQVNVAANADSAGILPALGLNTFFVHDSNGNIKVRDDLLAHPELFAASISGQPGDSTNVTRIMGLRNLYFMSNQSQTFESFLANVIGNVGTQVQDATNRKSAFDALGAQLQDQKQAAIGVDTNEELIKLVQYQRSYQMSAHFISAVNQAINDLLQLV